MYATLWSSTIKLLLVKHQESSYGQWIKMIQEPIFWPRTSDEAKLYEKSIKFQYRVRNGYMAMTAIAFCSLCIKPLFYFSKRRDLMYSFYEFLPKDKTINYIIMYIYQMGSTLILAIATVAFDSLVTSACIHLKGQLDIICWRLEHLDSNLGILPEKKSLREQLLDSIECYNCIVKLSKFVENLLMIPVSIQVTCSLLVFIANLLLVFLVSCSANVSLSP